VALIGCWTLHEGSAGLPSACPLTHHFRTRLSYDRVQFCPGLVDLVIGVGGHGCGGHRLALVGERFVGRLTEDIAQVGDRGGEFGDCRRGEGIECETGDGGCQFEASDAVEESRESCQGATVTWLRRPNPQTGSPPPMPGFPAHSGRRVFRLHSEWLAGLRSIATSDRRKQPSALTRSLPSSVAPPYPHRPGAGAPVEQQIHGLPRIPPRAVPATPVTAALALFLLFWQWRTMPAVIWDVSWLPGRIGLWILFALGWATVLMSTFMIDHFDLFGLRQVYLAWCGAPYTDLEFRTSLLYRVVRHPLMLGFIIAFWATPTMTVGHLLFAAATTSYILIALQFEEHDLTAALGEQYRDYRGRMPMLVPGLRRSGDHAAPGTTPRPA
jgi:protein-S-isoprenylcysteine O-methyltransferase Ste14